MAKQYGEKLKILFLRDYLLKYSDENHTVTVQDMLDYLSGRDLPAERKSIYRDLKTLGKADAERGREDDNTAPDHYGMDIVHKRGKYYVRSRAFTLQEVKLLVDMVQSSNFITRTKTRQLIEKITSLTSVYEAQTLNRTVYVRNRVKAMNESVYNNVDKISEAINNDGVISFQYFTYNLQKKKELRHNGKIHIVSPFALIWVDQNYYLLGYNHEYRELRPFRVDRMTRISLQDGPRLGKEDFEKIDIAMFTTKVFHMYTGEVKLVRMRFMKYLADAVIDRFGEEVMLIPDGEDAFTVTTEVAVSPQFYGWLSGFGSSAEILAPQDVREGMAKHTHSILNLYS